MKSLVIDGRHYTNIRPKPWWMLVIPWTGKTTCNALYPYIYFPKHMYDDIFSASPNPWWISTVIHEHEHIVRQKKDGPALWTLKYLFIRRFRFEEELAASEPQFTYLKQQGLTF